MFPSNFVSAREEYNTYTKNIPAPIFRKDFNAENIPTTSYLTIGATGFYELYLNGENITDGFLAPYIANSDDIVFYRKYDIADKLRRGANTIAVILGNGFANPMSGKIWGHTDRVGRGAPAFALKCDFFSEKDMRWSDSHILFDDERCGTYCDRRLENPAWYLPVFDDFEWNEPTICAQPHGEKRFVASEPVRITKHLKAKCISKGSVRTYRIRDEFREILPTDCSLMTPAPFFGGFIYDFGENCAGIPMLKIKGEPGQKIYMQFSEMLFEGFVDYVNVDVYPNGCCQQDIYICRGDEDGETYIPPFTYHGARYCYIWGITPEQATAELLTFSVIHNDVERRSGFSCDVEIVNEIYDACIRSDESNMVHIFTDCPTREKNGWTGDIGISAEQYMTAFGVENCFNDFLASLRNAQQENGGLPLMVPSAGNCDGRSPVWDSALVFMPYYAYIYTGRTDMIEENAKAIIKNIRHSLSLCDERGIIESGMGDWLPVGKCADQYDSPQGFHITAMVIEMCRMCEIMFTKIDKNDYAEECGIIKHRLLKAIRAEYLECALIGTGRTKKYKKPCYRPCLTSQALAICLGIFTEEEKKDAYKELIKLSEEANYSFDCGFLGLRYLFHALTEAGRSDIAYKMITKPTYPSYANMIIRGETTVWERFSEPGRRIGSHNHHFLCDVSSWFVKTIGGIRVNPNLNDPNCVYIDPEFIDGINEAKAFTKTPDGEVKVHWVRENDKVHLNIKASGDINVTLSEKAKNAI